MARTIQEIYDAMALEKSEQSALTGLVPEVDTAQALLQDVTSPSKVARWRLWLWVVATAMWVHEKLWDQHRAEVDAIVAAAHIGTPRWYVQQALAFQYGYELVLVGNVFQYPAIVPEAQIVKRAAIVETGGTAILKVAKLVSGVVTALTSAEVAAFSAYIDDIRLAGTAINILTDDPDLLHVEYTVEYDPNVLTSTGALITDPDVFPVRDAITAFIANLPFNGKLVLNNMTDAVQAATGVVNPTLTTARAKWGALPYAAINVRYSSHAGHMAIDPALPLSATLTYVPYAG